MRKQPPAKDEQSRRSSVRFASRLRLVAALLIVLLIAVAVWLFLIHRRATEEPESVKLKLTASYVETSTCAECHQKEFQDWTGSDHQLAMALPSDQTVHGDFNNSVFSNYGVTSRFFKREGKFFVNTEADGRLADFEIKYTFGSKPLQQYLIEFPGGRLQALGVAWDTNRKQWFHLYPNEKLAHDDPLHWTRLYQNWNMMCADCHSTNEQKNYDPQTDTYRTSFAAINVSCQSCHGPGSAHLEWAQQRQAGKLENVPAMGLVVNFKSGTPQDQVSACLPCHSRRLRLTADDWAGRPFLDNFLPALLAPGLYHADGQILDEDYEYGSFLQSRMYVDGVRCVDCHNAHTLQLKAAGNALCVQCHSERADHRFPKLIPKVYDTPAHTFHKANSPGTLCVNCHMAAKNYMVVDARRDHSFRIPRPDVSVRIGTPNACNGCHKDKPAQWSAAAVAKWYGPNRRQEPHYGEVIAAGRAGGPEAGPQLLALAGNKDVPAIVRATALELLRNYGPAVNAAMIAATKDPDPLVRVAAVSGLEPATADEKLAVVPPLLRDPIRAVRIEAGRVLAGVPSERLDPDGRRAFEAALTEYQQAQIYNADTPAGNLNLGLLETSLRQFDQAISHYRLSIRLDPEFIPARVNLANLFNQLGRNAEAEHEFREAIARAPGNGDLPYSLGLLLAEEKRLKEATEEFRKAAILLPERARVQYNYALALQQSGRMTEAAVVLRKAYQLNSQDADVVNALVLCYVQQEDWARALPYAQALVRLTPGATEPTEMLKRIEAKINGSLRK